MSRRCKNNYNLFLPFFVPMAISVPLSGWVAAKASFAYATSKCDLDLPWGHATAVKMIDKYYHSAWAEFSTLERISTQCVANLHADTTSAFLCIAAVALLCGVLSMPFANLLCDPELRQENGVLLRGSAIFLVAAVLFVAVGIGHASSIEVINFTKEKRRISVDFTDGYIDINSYWIITQSIVFVLSSALWFFHGALVCLRRYLVKSG